MRSARLSYRPAHIGSAHQLMLKVRGKRIFDVLKMNLGAEGYDLNDNLPVDRDQWTRNTPTLPTNNQLFCR